MSAEPREATLRLTRPDAGPDALARLAAVLESGWLTGGPQLERFEAALAARLDVPHVVAVNSGTSALQLSLVACGIGKGDAVLVPDFTFPATANAVEHTGARAVLVDVEPESLNLDLRAAAAAVTPETRAILPVHQFGWPMALDALEAFAVRHGLLLLEDAACALGAEHRGRRCGSVGRAGCFSFHPRKVLTTGEGGAIATRDRALAARCRSLRSHGAGSDTGDDYEQIGFNYRLSDLHAALGLAQLERLDQLLDRRGQLAGQYRERLAGLPLGPLPDSPPDGRHAFQSFVVRLPEAVSRDGVQRALDAQGIETRVPARAIHTLPYYQRRYGHKDGELPVSYRASRQALALPLYPAMRESDVERVARALRAALEAR